MKLQKKEPVREPSSSKVYLEVHPVDLGALQLVELEMVEEKKEVEMEVVEEVTEEEEEAEVDLMRRMIRTKRRYEWTTFCVLEKCCP